MKNAIAYYRVSTDRQGKSGLGLEAQHSAVHLFAQLEGYQVTAEFTEIESGKKNQRPELLAALLQCKKQKATLIIAKLDRLGRNVGARQHHFRWSSPLASGLGGCIFK